MKRNDRNWIEEGEKVLWLAFCLYVLWRLKKIILIFLFLTFALLFFIGKGFAKDIPVILLLDTPIEKSERALVALIDEINSYYKVEKVKVYLKIMEIRSIKLGGKEEDWEDIFFKVQAFDKYNEIVIVFKFGKIYAHSTYELNTTVKHEKTYINGVVSGNIIIMNNMNRNVLLHELGHLFDLGHNLNDDIMSLTPDRNRRLILSEEYRNAAEKF